MIMAMHSQSRWLPNEGREEREGWLLNALTALRLSTVAALTCSHHWTLGGSNMLISALTWEQGS